MEGGKKENGGREEREERGGRRTEITHTILYSLPLLHLSVYMRHTNFMHILQSDWTFLKVRFCTKPL